MQVQKLNKSVYYNSYAKPLLVNEENGTQTKIERQRIASGDSVSFGKNDIGIAKRLWMFFGNVSDYMKQPSEMVSAIIQAIGTSIVAPIAILSSPNRHVHNEEEKKTAREKKVFQAYRQPFSALIALGFQVPATIAIGKAFDYYAYKKPSRFFKDEDIGNLIPNKKYLAKQAEKALKENASQELLTEWSEELAYATNSEQVKTDLIKEIREKYERRDITLSEEKLDKMASNKKRIKKFVAEKMASSKHGKLLDAKVRELSGRSYDIKDIDLVTEEDMNLAREKFKDEFKALKKEMLNWFDKCIKVMGFGVGNVDKYNKAEEELAKQKGLELLRQDKPEIFADPAAKFKQFVKNRDELATKVYNNKKFWIQLGINLAMVAISCTVLNWMHPKFMEFLDGIKQAKKEEEARKSAKIDANRMNASKKVEVAA